MTDASASSRSVTPRRADTPAEPMTATSVLYSATCSTADGSKFGDVALSTVAPIKRVSAIITDPSADPIEVERIEREGVEVIQVEPGTPAPAGGPSTVTADGSEPVLAAR